METIDKHIGYLCQKALYKRGWTPAMIREAAITPDAITKNPHDPTWAPQKLYRTDMIEMFERTDWFRERFFIARKRGQRKNKKVKPINRCSSSYSSSKSN